MLNVIKFRIDNLLLIFNSTPECTKASGLQTLTSCTYDVSVVPYQCISVVINKTEIRNTAGIAGIAAVNIMGNSIISKLTIIHPKNTFAVKKARPRNYKYLEPNVKKQKENSSAEVKSNW